jgi:hypothetical protein
MREKYVLNQNEKAGISEEHKAGGNNVGNE